MRKAPDPAAQASAELRRSSPRTPICAIGCSAPWPTWRTCAGRTEREKADTARYAISNFARDVLTVGDNLRRTIEHVPADAAAQDPALKSFLDGVELTERELLNVLERHGVTRIDPVGQRFDPNCHQAMYEVQNPDVPGRHRRRRDAGWLCDRRPLLAAGACRGGQGRRQAGGAEPAGDGPPKAANDDFPAAAQAQGRREPPIVASHRAAGIPAGARTTSTNQASSPAAASD